MEEVDFFEVKRLVKESRYYPDTPELCELRLLYHRLNRERRELRGRQWKQGASANAFVFRLRLQEQRADPVYKEKSKAQNRAYRQTHQEQINAQKRARYQHDQAYRERVRAYQKAYYSEK